MESYTATEIKRLAAMIEPRRGRDFSRVRARRAPVPWEFLQVAKGYLNRGDAVLDIGTGGGEKLVALSDHFHKGIGVDFSREMIQTARENTPYKLRFRIHFTRAPANAVPADSGYFNVVLTRHAPIFPKEIDRLLKPGGYFINQDVGENNASTIFQRFEEARGPVPRQVSELMSPHAAAEFAGMGYELVEQREYDVEYLFEDVESLLFWLQAVPVPADFSIERDVETVVRIVDDLSTEYGILTNEHRKLLVVRKPT